jgi:hypothetical protein
VLSVLAHFVGGAASQEVKVADEGYCPSEPGSSSPTCNPLLLKFPLADLINSDVSVWKFIQMLLSPLNPLYFVCS